MYLRKLAVKNLRCFVEQEFEFNEHVTLIEGLNGAGKTTIVEALYYLCYLRSFRTNLTQELIRFSSSEFFVKADLLAPSEQVKQTLQVGFSPGKRLVQLNERSVGSFKQLIQNYRVVVLTEEDLELIKGSPEIRRSFIDQHIYLQDPGWANELRRYKKTIDQRNALLKSGRIGKESYLLWTAQVAEKTELIRKRRIEALNQMEAAVNEQLRLYFDQSLEVGFQYLPKDWDLALEPKERMLERTLFGAHLEDFLINLAERSGRKYASRGQQKLITILIKAVQVILLKKAFSGAILLLLDDFVTDLDDLKIATLVKFLKNLGVQLIFTTPNLQHHHRALLLESGGQVITV